MSPHWGQQRVYRSSPRWYTGIKNHSGMLLTENSWLIHQSSLAILPAQSSSSFPLDPKFVGDKNLQHAFLRRENKAGNPYPKILQHVKNHLGSRNKNSLQGKIHHFFCLFLLLATRWVCWYDCLRALVEESVFLCQYYSTVVLHAHISPGGWKTGPLAASVHRHLTPLTRSIK
jgi:hypothetical protein